MKTKPILIIISLILITILVAACNDVDESQKADSNYTTQDTKVFSNGPKNPSIIINNGDVSTDSRTVNLSLSANDNQAVIACLISESSTKPLANANNWIPVGSSASYSGDSSFVLSSAEAGLKTVYVWFKDGEGNISATTNDSIDYPSAITVNPTSITTSETGSTAAFSVGLNTEPGGEVMIDVVSSDTTEGIVDSSLLTFTTANWDSNQTITVTGQDDNVIDSSQSFAIQLTLNSGSTADTTGYALLDPDDVSIINYDDDWELPDTGQTTSFTPTFGEDHDYLINPPSFTDNSDGTVTDNNTGLVWQQDDDNNTYTWSAAAIICENVSLGGETDWRLPNRRELISIVNFGTSNPTINSTVFPNINSSYYWSSTTYAGGTGSAWFVYFYDGYVIYSGKSSSYYVRCVRGGD